MFNLLSDKIEGLSCKTIDNVININISKSIDNPLFIDWNECQKDIKITLDKNVKIKLLELNFCDANCEYILQENSSLDHNFVALSSGGESKRKLLLEKGASWNASGADLSSDNVHMLLTCDLMDERSNGKFNLSTLSKQNSEKVFDINFIHHEKNTISEMKNYGVVRDEAKLSFVGIGHIKKGAKATLANQSAKIMVFDKKCKASASPILKIDENDTNASHAAAVGKINDEHLFYLMSRGINENEAKRLITLGYLYPVLSFFFDKETKQEVEKCILERV